MTAVAGSDGERDVDNERILLDCFVGSNWLLTAYSAAVAVIDEFRETVSREGELGALDGLPFSRPCSNGS